MEGQPDMGKSSLKELMTLCWMMWVLCVKPLLTAITETLTAALRTTKMLLRKLGWMKMVITRQVPLTTKWLIQHQLSILLTSFSWMVLSVAGKPVGQEDSWCPPDYTQCGSSCCNNELQHCDPAQKSCEDCADMCRIYNKHFEGFCRSKCPRYFDKILAAMTTASTTSTSPTEAVTEVPQYDVNATDASNPTGTVDLGFLPIVLSMLLIVVAVVVIWCISVVRASRRNSHEQLKPSTIQPNGANREEQIALQDVSPANEIEDEPSDLNDVATDAAAKPDVDTDLEETVDDRGGRVADVALDGSLKPNTDINVCHLNPALSATSLAVRHHSSSSCTSTVPTTSTSEDD